MVVDIWYEIDMIEASKQHSFWNSDYPYEMI